MSSSMSSLLLAKTMLLRRSFSSAVRRLVAKSNASRSVRGPSLRLYEATRSWFQRNPLLANSVAMGGIYLGAEVSQQTLSFFTRRWREGKQRDEEPARLEYDLVAIRNFGFVGSCIFAPICRFWYGFLDNKFKGTSGKIVARKMFFDQLFFAPLCLVVFFVTLNCLEGKPDVFDELKEKFWHTYAIDCLFWLPVQATNFLFVPPVFRVLYLGTFCFLWINILCVIKNIDSYRSSTAKA